MQPWVKVLIAVAFSVAATLVAMEALVLATGEPIEALYWVFAMACPVLVSAPISYVLVRQAEANRQLNQELVETQRALLTQADRDHLTGVLNRAAFYRLAAAYCEDAPASILLADIDHFKAINDRHGHAAGDEALRLVSKTLQAALRPDDLVGRIGGEEFAILLTGMPQPLALAIAERACGAIAALMMRAPDGTLIPLSISIGVAPYAAGMALDRALAEADAAMYAAKRNGRNRVQRADEA
jgi:diguanylate cyclase (GGDEF)-like protein